MMSMCCDHRVMSSVGSIGLNEVQLGIPVPKFWGLLMAKLIGPQAADKLLLTGRLVTPAEVGVVVWSGGGAAVHGQARDAR